MADEAVKKRINRAINKAKKDLIKMGYYVTVSDNSPICLIAFRSMDIRIIRIVLERIDQKDKNILMGLEAPPVCSREIWMRKIGNMEFEKFLI